MKRLQDKLNVVSPTTDDPYGQLKDDTGDHTGTYANTEMLQDAMVFFERLMIEANITPNGNRDNIPNGFQLIDALTKITKPYKSYEGVINQTGTSAPTITIYGFNEIGNIVWTRSSAGVYVGTLSGAFSARTAIFLGPPNSPNQSFGAFFSGTDTVRILSSLSGTLTDGILTATALEIRVYDELI